jgi:hypothetical protein
VGWGTDRPPQRFSYYGVQLGSTRLSRDLDAANIPLRRPAFLQTAVVSYGALFRDATAGEHAAVWRPGVRSLVAVGRESWCEPKVAAGDLGVAGILDALSVGSGLPAAACTTPVGGAANAPTQAAALLAATRSGFRDGFAEMLACNTNDRVAGNPTNCDGSPNGEADRRRGNILPMNFDVAAFQEALADTTPGELGSYFCPPAVDSCGAFMGRPFNGIVYIAAPYPGSERGYGLNGGSDIPAQLPIPGKRHDNNGQPLEPNGVNFAEHLENSGLALGRPRNDDAAAAVDTFSWTTAAAMPLLLDHTDSNAVNYREARDDEVAALPYPLCSDTPGVEPLTSGGYVFRRPDCNDDRTFTRINGVRIINARRVNSNTPPTVAPAVADAGSIPPFPGAPVLSAAAVGQLPRGLSIVSNLPVYVVGDVNITSDAYADPSDQARHWVPFLVGGDVVHPLSNFWNDGNARWATSNGQLARRASVTRYYMEMLSGWGMTVATASSGGLHNFPRALENWGSGTTANCRGTGDFAGGCPAIIHGSLVIGHNRVTTSWPFRDANGDIGRSPPRRDWGFDPHLNDLEKQPPGTPLFDVSAVRQWTRR